MLRTNGRYQIPNAVTAGETASLTTENQMNELLNLAATVALAVSLMAYLLWPENRRG